MQKITKVNECYTTCRPRSFSYDYGKLDTSVMTLDGSHETQPTLIRCKFSPQYTD